MVWRCSQACVGPSPEQPGPRRRGECGAPGGPPDGLDFWGDRPLDMPHAAGQDWGWAWGPREGG